jgi:hypothetical protein
MVAHETKYRTLKEEFMRDQGENYFSRIKKEYAYLGDGEGHEEKPVHECGCGEPEGPHIHRVGAPGGPDLSQPDDHDHNGTLLFDKEMEEGASPFGTGGPSKEGGYLLADDSEGQTSTWGGKEVPIKIKGSIPAKKLQDGMYVLVGGDKIAQIRSVGRTGSDEEYGSITAALSRQISAADEHHIDRGGVSEDWEYINKRWLEDDEVQVVVSPMKALHGLRAEAALKSHQSIDTARWNLEHDPEEDKPNEEWEGFGDHSDYLKTEAPEHRMKVPGGGPEFEDDPYAELEFPDPEELEDPEYQTYLQSLAQTRDSEERSHALGDIGEFIDPDDLPW